jgi:hypothetical protein
MLHSLLGGPILQNPPIIAEDPSNQAQRLLQRIKALSTQEVQQLLKANKPQEQA